MKAYEKHLKFRSARKALHLSFLSGEPFPFQDIPVEHQDHGTIVLWLTANLGSLRDIPTELVNDKTRLMATRVGQRSSFFDPAWESAQFLLSQPEYAHLHDQVLMILMEDGGKYITKIDQELVTRDFMLGALEINGDCLRPYLNDDGDLQGLSFPLDQELIDAAVSNTTSLFEAFKPEQYSTKAIKAILDKSSFSSYEFLHRIGHYETFISMMRDEGHWPSNDPKPKYLWDAAEKLMKCKGDRSLYQLFLRTFPMDEVIAEMKTPARRKELLSILTSDETAHYLKVNTALKNDRRFKARLLEQDLGM